MDGLKSFLAMGGYASFVWSAYGFAALLLLGNMAWNKRQRRLVFKRLARRYQGENL